MWTKIKVVFWTSYLMLLFVNYNKGISPSLFFTFIPIFILVINSWANYIGDLLIKNEDFLKFVLGNRWEEFKNKLEDMEELLDNNDKNEKE